MNIVLTGFMATGKTQISKAIAAISEYRFIDTDQMITEAAGKTVKEIFADCGEEGFRRLESEAIKKAAALDGCVIATGGGAVLNADNMRMLRKNGVIVNLAPTFDVIAARIASAKNTRPLLQEQSIDEIRKRFYERQPFYDNCDIKINIINGRSPELYAHEILDKLSFC